MDSASTLSTPASKGNEAPVPTLTVAQQRRARYEELCQRPVDPPYVWRTNIIGKVCLFYNPDTTSFLGSSNLVIP